MNISKPVKILIGILTLFIFLLAFLMHLFSIIFIVAPSLLLLLDPYSALHVKNYIMAAMPVILALCLTMTFSLLFHLGLMIFYVVHEIKNKTLAKMYRILFVIGTFLLPDIAMPIYFITYLWKDQPLDVSNSQTELDA